MSRSEEPRPRIIVKKGHGGGHHGGAWKVAYADFVTTMMALFIVLWIVGQSDAVKQAVASYFKHPGVFKESPVSSPLPAGSGLLPGDRQEPAASAKEQDDSAQDERALQEAATQIRRLIAEGGAFVQLRDQVEITVTPEGLRIELIEKEGSPFFQVGSAVPIPQLKALLENLEKILVTLPNHITIEGHTDARQYSRERSYSNWELSTDRAHSARRLMEGDGPSSGRVDRVVGHADRLLRVPEEPMNASNRRITLLVRRQN